MAGKAIGKNLERGYPGAISRSVDAVVSAKPNAGATAIKFGDPVVLATGGVAKFASSNNANDFVGIAVREVKTSHTYAGNNPQYNQYDTVDFLTRGNIMVKCTVDANATDTPVKGNPVYIRLSSSEFVATNQNTLTVKLNNVVWAETGNDTDGVAEVTILERHA